MFLCLKVKLVHVMLLDVMLCISVIMLHWGFVIQILCYVMVGYTDKSAITCRAISPNQNAISLQCNKSSWLYLHGFVINGYQRYSLLVFVPMLFRAEVSK